MYVYIALKLDTPPIHLWLPSKACADLLAILINLRDVLFAFVWRFWQLINRSGRFRSVHTSALVN